MRLFSLLYSRTLSSIMNSCYNICTDATAVAAKKTAKVVFNYDATLADELTIKKGDIVEVVGEEEPGWYVLLH